MKQRRGKPSRLQWIMSLVLILAGLLFSLPVFPEEIRRSLPQALFVPGFVVLLVLWRQKEKYDDLPLEERKELDRENRDGGDYPAYRRIFLDGAVYGQGGFSQTTALQRYEFDFSALLAPNSDL